jgi:hypothetical protein
MDSWAAVAEPCAGTLTDFESFSVTGRDTIAYTNSVTFAYTWCHTVAEPIAVSDPDSRHAWGAAL